ncbi:MAG: TolC family protein [Thermoanaerobaculia bacterium]
MTAILLVLLTRGEMVAQMTPATPAPSAVTPATPPLSLAAATSAALQQVSAYQQAQIDEQIAAEDVRQAQAALLPRVRDSFSVAYNSPAHRPQGGIDPASPSFIAQNGVHEYQNLLGVTGDLNYGVVAAIRRARALLRAAHAGTEVARRAFVRGVGEAYYAAALATAKRRAAEASLAAAQEFERVTDLNYNAGEVPEVDAIRSRLLTAQRRDELAQAQRDEVIANASIGTLLGYGTTRAPSLDELPQTIDTSDLGSITADGIVRRPEFAQLEAQVAAARADVGVARSDLLPRLTYSVDKGFDTSSLSREEMRLHRGTLATANLDVPIFDWGTTFSKIRQANLRAKSAEQQRQLAIRDLLLQFATARQEAMTAADRVENARRAVADAERNVSISIARYRAGEAPITEATDAQTTLAQQRLALQQALYDYQIARAHLREAAGE